MVRLVVLHRESGVEREASELDGCRRVRGATEAGGYTNPRRADGTISLKPQVVTQEFRNVAKFA
jgi:hypothetical protein